MQIRPSEMLAKARVAIDSIDVILSSIEWPRTFAKTKNYEISVVGTCINDVKTFEKLTQRGWGF